MTLSFSGHESFHCRLFWLKKGYNFVQDNQDFNDSQAVVTLGVGRNMVASIRYWLKAFGLLTPNGALTEIATYLFGEEDRDPHLLYPGSIYLLHYHLIVTNQASIYNLVFNQFRKERLEFTKTQLLNFLNRMCTETDTKTSSKTINRDINVFLRTYLRPTHSDQEKTKNKAIESHLSSILIDLDMVQKLEKSEDSLQRYKIESQARLDIPPEIMLYSILQQEQGHSIAFNRLLYDTNSVGVIYALTADGLMQHINRITAMFPDTITFKDDAGIRELQFKERPNNPLNLLDNYYTHHQNT